MDRVEALVINEALAETMGVVTAINVYLDRTAPWKQSRAGKADRASTILYHAMEALRLISVLLQPVMPEKMSELWYRLGWEPPKPLAAGLEWGQLPTGSSVILGPPLFPRDLRIAS